MTQRHAVMMMCYNNLHLTKQALGSIVDQDIGPLEILIINNGSTDGTREWLDGMSDGYVYGSFEHKLRISHHATNQSPVAMFNHGAQMLFDWGHDKFLAVANDVVLPSNAYRLMNEYPRGIITASQTTDRNFPRVEEAHMASECTPMALALFRKWVWDALISLDGFFYDEGMFHYASDCDLALRITACGIRGGQLDLPYFHAGSSTLLLAPPEVHRAMNAQADLDREFFERKWGFPCDSLEYGKVPQDINFKGKPKA